MIAHWKKVRFTRKLASNYLLRVKRDKTVGFITRMPVCMANLMIILTDTKNVEKVSHAYN